MSFVTEWNEKALLAKVSGIVLRGMDRACAFAAEQAAANAPRRAEGGGTLASEIDYEVRGQRAWVVGLVGVKKGKAYYGYFQELGTSKMAARPFLRPAVFGNGDQIVKLIAEG